jgi:hypothetical protein
MKKERDKNVKELKKQTYGNEQMSDKQREEHTEET